MTGPKLMLVRLRRPLLCGGRLHPAGAAVPLSADLAETLCALGRAYAHLRERFGPWRPPS